MHITSAESKFVGKLTVLVLSRW